jgi:hypothetical protein
MSDPEKILKNELLVFLCNFNNTINGLGTVIWKIPKDDLQYDYHGYVQAKKESKTGQAIKILQSNFFKPIIIQQAGIPCNENGQKTFEDWELIVVSPNNFSQIANLALW